MTAFFENLFSSIFGNNAVLATILIAMVPLIELKGAIPFGMSGEIWKGAELSKWGAFGCGVLGSCLVVPILALIYIPLIKWLKGTKLFRRIAEKIENRINAKKQSVEKRNSKKSFVFKILSVFLFVALPLPLTGVWTGTCLAVALGLGFWVSTIVVILGNICAGLIITLLSSIIPPMTFFYVFLALIAIAIIFLLVKSLINKKNV